LLPTVVEVGSVARVLGVPAEEQRPDNLPITQLAVTFSEPMSDPVGDTEAGDVTNPSNYLLVADGPDNTIQTLDCASGVDSQDQRITLVGVVYDSTTAYLSNDAPGSLAAGGYRLFVCGDDGLVATSGNALDGDSDGLAGGDFSIDFAVQFDNLIQNPNFDTGVESWSFIGDVTAALSASNADFDGTLTSGSAEISGASGDSDLWQATQCVTLTPSRSYVFAAQVQIEADISEPSAALTIELFEDGTCASPAGSPILSELVTGDTQGQFVSITPLRANSGTSTSAAVSLTVSTESSVAFSVRFDTVTLNQATEIFTDGFEEDSP
jgi:hypothetical protein